MCLVLVWTFGSMNVEDDVVRLLLESSDEVETLKSKNIT